VSTRDVLVLNERLLKKGASNQPFEMADYDIRIADLENPDEVIRTIKSRLAQAQAFRMPFEEQWRSSFLGWMQRLDSKKETSWESKRYMPVILQQVETAVPVQYSSVFNGPHIWQFHGDTPEGRDAADALDKLIHWQAKGPCKLPQKFDEFTFFRTLFGTGLFDVKWSTKEESRWKPVVVFDINPETGEPIIDPKTGEPKKVKVLKNSQVKVEDWPIVRPINPLDIWIAPHSGPGDECDWFVERVETTYKKIRKASGKGHLDAEAVAAWIEEGAGRGRSTLEDKGLWEAANVGLWDQWLQEAGLESRDDLGDGSDIALDDQVVFLMEYRSKTERITVAPGDRIIGYSHNPYIHQKTGLIIDHFIPVWGCPYGRGLGPILLGHQELVNENINNYMDTARLALMAPVIMNRNSVNPLDKNTVWTPNKLIYARDVNNAMKRAEVSPPTDLAMMVDQHLRRDAQTTSGYSEQSMGIGAAGTQTATESNILQNNAQTRTYMHVERLKETMRLLGNMLISLNQQFMTEEQVCAVVGEDGLDYHKVEPWQIVGNVQVQAVSSATRANPSLRVQQLTGVMSVFLPILSQGAVNPTIMRLMRSLLKAADVEDVDLIIPKNIGKMRDARVENVALSQGVMLKPSEYDQHDLHMQIHGICYPEKSANGAHPDELRALEQHMQEHAALAFQMGQAAMGGGMANGQQMPPQADMMGGGPEGKQAATGLSAGVGNPGHASPGPAAPPGRPV
jgi:hypothetical protein